jgi:hypothetical protein
MRFTWLLAAALAVVSVTIGCSFLPMKPTWTMTVDSKPSGAIVLGNWRESNGTVSFKPLGTTPYTVTWRQAYEDETLKVQSGDQTVTVVPIENRSIFVDFSVSPPVVTGANVISR